jgi:hypothetical protein
MPPDGAFALQTPPTHLPTYRQTERAAALREAVSVAFADSVSNLAEAREVQLQLYATQTNSSQRDALIESLQVT